MPRNKNPIITVVLFLFLGLSVFAGNQDARQKKKQAGAEATEIIKVSRLAKMKKREFAIERDIFSPFKKKINLKPKQFIPPPPPVSKDLEKQRKDEERMKGNLAAETRGAVTYEGYVFRSGKRLALVSVGGEFYTVGIDELIMEKFLVKSIEKDILTVEVDATNVEINLKGDDENENPQQFTDK